MPPNMDTFTMLPIERSENNLTMSCKVGDMAFSAVHWYKGVNLYELEDTYGAEFMDRLYFHIAAFELNKLLCLRPKYFDLGPYAKYRTAEFEKLFLTHFYGAWSQWRYENDLPDYKGPEFLGKVVDGQGFMPVSSKNPVGCDMLSLIGGGKDSLSHMRIFKDAGIKFDTLGYSNNIYGTASLQHELIEKLASTHGCRHHKIWHYDQLMDSPVLELQGEKLGINSLLADETTQSCFSVLLIILQYGYRFVNVGHEGSADFPNLVWDKTGEEVNHQWAKSLECGQMISNYIETHIVTNCHFFSCIKPIRDVLIFTSLNLCKEFVPLTHSCNERKPWCKRCAKCSYVWLGYMAYLPLDLVNGMFKENLMDVPGNLLFFRQMMGLEEHTPFECLGQIDESILAFELCHRKGVRGKAMDIYVKEVRGSLDIEETTMRLTEVDKTYPLIPEYIANGVTRVLNQRRDAARAYIKMTLDGTDVVNGIA